MTTDNHPNDGLSHSRCTKTYSSDSDSYRTPQWIIRRLQRAIGDGRTQLFDLDPAALPDQTGIAVRTFTRADNGLTKTWKQTSIDTIWLNPPYSKPEPFLDKLTSAIDPCDPNAATVGFALLRADTSTNWFHSYLPDAARWCLFDQRIQFDGSTDATFPNILAVYGDVTPAVDDAIDDFGTVIVPDASTENKDDTQSCLPVPDADSKPTLNICHVINGEISERSSVVPVSQLDPYDHLILQPSPYENSPTHQPVEIFIRQIALKDSQATINATGHTANGKDVCFTLTVTSTGFQAKIAIDTDDWKPFPVETIYQTIS